MAREQEPAVRLTEADAGGQIALRTGEYIEITLAEDRTNGYRWYLDVDPVALRVADDDFVVESAATGAAGTRTLVLEALRPGRTRLRCVQRRPWNAEPLGSYEVDVDLTP